jgi:hypothetical protein
VLYKPPSTSPQAITVIRAELLGSDRAVALGIEARAAAPVLMLCRLLVEAGHDPDHPLHAYRGDVLALKVRAIGEAAQLEINARGTGLIPRHAVRTASPMRPNGSGGR